MSLTVFVRSALVFACLVTASPVLAAPDFTKSEVTLESKTVTEAGIATFIVTVRNSGPDNADSTTATVYWPVDGFLVDAPQSGLAVFDYVARSMSMTFPLAAGAEREFRLRVLLPRRAAGREVTLEVRVANTSTRTEYWFRREATVLARPSRSGLRLGPVRIPPAALALTLLAVGGVLLRVVVRRLTERAPKRRRRRRRPFAFVGPGLACGAVTMATAFWTMFAALAWRDHQTLTDWEQTTCRVLGGRMSAFATPPGGGVAPVTSRTDANFVSVLGLEYPVEGTPVHSTGYDTGMQLEFGGRNVRPVELEEWFIGARIPCWYNPDDSKDVVVRRGYGGVYLFVLFPAPLFAIGAMRIRSLVTGRG